MSNYEFTINVDIKKTENSTSDGINKNRDGSFRIVLPQESAQSIDLCEQALLKVSCLKR